MTVLRTYPYCVMSYGYNMYVRFGVRFHVRTFFVAVHWILPSLVFYIIYIYRPNYRILLTIQCTMVVFTFDIYRYIPQFSFSRFSLALFEQHPNSRTIQSPSDLHYQRARKTSMMLKINNEMGCIIALESDRKIGDTSVCPRQRIPKYLIYFV